MLSRIGKQCGESVESGRDEADVVVVGRSVADGASVPVHRLARAGCSQVRRGIHRLRRTGAQDQGTVRPGRTNHRTLQVRELLITHLYSLADAFDAWNPLQISLSLNLSSTTATASFPGQPGYAGTRKVEPVWI